MPEIRPSSDLRNNYGEISSFCHEHDEPVFITKNGKGDLAVMSIEMYERLAAQYELEKLIRKGIEDMEEGRVRPFQEVLADLKKRYGIDR